MIKKTILVLMVAALSSTAFARGETVVIAAVNACTSGQVSTQANPCITAVCASGDVSCTPPTTATE